MRLTKHATNDLSLSEHHEQQEVHEKEFPPSMRKALLGGTVLWMLILGILALITFGSTKSTFSLIFGITAVVGLLVLGIRLAAKRVEYFIDHYDEDG